MLDKLKVEIKLMDLEEVVKEVKLLEDRLKFTEDRNKSLESEVDRLSKREDCYLEILKEHGITERIR